MDSKNIEKPFHYSAINELERSVSLCTLCEFENKYLYTDTQVYGLSLPLIELSSTSDDFSSLNFTPERPSVSEDLATVATVPLYKDISVEEKSSNLYESTENRKISKKSPIINDDDISSSFLNFVQKTGKQVSEEALKARWDDVSWDKSDEKGDDENFQAETAIPTEQNSADSELTKNGIESFISDIDDFLNDKTKVEITVEERARQVAPPRSFVSGIVDEIPAKRSKACATARRFIDTPHPAKFSEGFMNHDNSTDQERSKIFAEDFRISSVIMSRERKSENRPSQNGVESLNTKSKMFAKELCRSRVQSSLEIVREEQVPRSVGIDNVIGENSLINVDKVACRSSVKSSPEVKEKMDTVKPEACTMPSDEGTVARISPMRSIISASTFVVSPLRIPLKSLDGNNRVELDDPWKKDNEDVPKTNVPTNHVISQTGENFNGEKSTKRSAEPGEELPGRNKRNRKSHCPEEASITEMGCRPDYTKMAEDKFEDQLEGVEKLITDGASESPQGASRNKQIRSEALKPEAKEKLTKSWKEVRKDFTSTKDKRPRYPPLALRSSPPPPDLKIIKARAAKRRGVLADAINRLSSLNSYMGEVRSIFRNDNKHYSIVKPTRSTNGRLKILVSTSTQTSDGGQDPADSLPVLPSVTVEVPAEKRREEPDIKNGGLFCYNLLHPQPDTKNEQALSETRSRSAQNDKPGICAVATVSEADTQNTLQQPPLIIEKPANLDNREEIKHDMHTYNPLRAQKAPKRLRKIALNKKPTIPSSKPLFLNRLL